MERIEPGDLVLLRRLPEAWDTALAGARQAGHGSELAALGALVDPDAALPDPAPPAGSYRCRTIKIGAQGDLLEYIAYSWFECDISDGPRGTLRFEKTTGSQRQEGYLYPDNDRRMVFLGALALGGQETAAPEYGEQPERDVAAVLERVGRERWRLVEPWPEYESIIVLLEIVPRSHGG